MHHSHEALTLRTYNFSEANKIVSFLTSSQGILRGVAYGAGKSKSRFGGALEPLTRVRILIRKNENQDLATIENCELIRALPMHELDLEQNLHISYFVELLTEFAREENDSIHLFRLTSAVLDVYPEVPVRQLARYFELWLLKLEGVLPGFTSIMGEELAAKSLRILKQPPKNLQNEAWDPTELRQLESATQKLVEYHLEKPLKTVRMLKELL
jgi:DNA repair protein RecO (recombination protein O)